MPHYQSQVHLAKLCNAKNQDVNQTVLECNIVLTLQLDETCEKKYIYMSQAPKTYNNIHFRCEVNQNKRSFLCTPITFHNACFSVNIYRKRTFTGLELHFLSCIPHTNKRNSLKTLINRACIICSTWASLHTCYFFKRLFYIELFYPSRLLHKVPNKFLRQMLSHKPAVTTFNRHQIYKTTLCGQSQF